MDKKSRLSCRFHGAPFVLWVEVNGIHFIWQLVVKYASNRCTRSSTAPGAVHPKKEHLKEHLMSKQEEAGLILKLYELRREATMRQARDWYFLEFNPESIADFTNALFGDHSGHLRMVITYWDMAAGLIHNGAISQQLFNDTNGEHIGVFAKIEPLLGEIRAAIGPQFAANFEKLIDATPDGRKGTAEARERIKAIRAQLSTRHATAAHANG
jgi:hypothetical protein